LSSLPPVSVAVVGHTNAGKTSLLRTLLRNTRFGEVSSHPGTTRHVEGGEILLGQTKVLQLYDTPGLEDSIGLNRILKSILAENDQQKLRTLTSFLARLDQYPEFDQEAKVVKQLLHNDIVFYVIDVREPVLGKYKDEIAILTMAAKPVIPVLNFVSGSLAYLPHWRKILKEFGLHALVEFDTVVFRFQDEKKLYEKIQALLADRYEQIQQLINHREQHWRKTNLSACRAVAELFIDVAGYRKDFEQMPEYEPDSRQDNAAIQGIINKQRLDFLEQVRRAEKACIADLLKIYGFSERDLVFQSILIRDDRWRLDLFDRDNLKNFGLNAGAGAMKGAALGVGIDAAAGGLTLGAAAAIGAALGAFWSTGRRYKNEIKAKFQGKQYFCIDDATLQVLWARQWYLLSHLGSRGHAATGKIHLQLADNLQSKPESHGQSNESDVPVKSFELPEQWPQWVKTIRLHPQWSALNYRNGLAEFSGVADKESEAYTETVDSIVVCLQQI